MAKSKDKVVVHQDTDKDKKEVAEQDLGRLKSFNTQQLIGRIVALEGKDVAVWGKLHNMERANALLESRIKKLELFAMQKGTEVSDCLSLADHKLRALRELTSGAAKLVDVNLQETPYVVGVLDAALENAIQTRHIIRVVTPDQLHSDIADWLYGDKMLLTITPFKDEGAGVGTFANPAVYQNGNLLVAGDAVPCNSGSWDLMLVPATGGANVYDDDCVVGFDVEFSVCGIALTKLEIRHSVLAA